MYMCAESVSDMSVSNITVVGAGGTFWFLHRYSVDEDIRPWSSRLNAFRFWILSVCSTLAVMVGRVKLETAHARCLRCWKHWGGRRMVDDHTHGKCMDMPFVRCAGKCLTKNDLQIYFQNSGLTGLPRRLPTWIFGVVVITSKRSGSPPTTHTGLSISTSRFGFCSVLLGNYPTLWGGTTSKCSHFRQHIVMRFM